jgi:hypothetical protein
MEKTLVLLEEVAGKNIIVAENIFYPKVGEIELTVKGSGKVIAGVITNPEIVKNLFSAFGVTPWTGINPKVVVKKSKDNTYSLKLATQVDEAKLPRLV